METTNPQIVVKNISKIYGKGSGQNHALNDVSLTINQGELVVILGSSGSGKTTLLNMIGGIDTPTEGKVTVNQRDLSLLNDKDLTLYRRDEVGFIFQSFNLISDLTVKENITLAARLSNKNENIDHVIELMGLSNHANNYPSQLSGGQQQRVSIGRALVKDAAFFLCDEPTGALDYSTGKQILSILENISKKEGKTVIIVTHTVDIGKIANRVIKMKNGQIISEKTNENPQTVEQIEW